MCPIFFLQGRHGTNGRAIRVHPPRLVLVRTYTGGLKPEFQADGGREPSAVQKKKNERGVFESFTNEVDWSLMSGRQIFKRNYFSSPRTLKRCKWSRVAVQFLSRYWPISSIVIKLLFLYMFSMFMAPASNFRFGSCKRISYFFLFSLVIEPRPVFFAFVCANAVGISSCHDSFNEI